MASGCQVSGILATILRCTKFYGLAPLQFDRDGRCWRIRVSKGYAVYGYVIVILWTLIYVANIISYQHSLHSDTLLLQTFISVTTLDGLLMVVTAFTMVAIAPYWWKRLIKEFSKLDQVNSYTSCTAERDSKTKICIVVASLGILFGLSGVDIISMNAYPTYLGRNNTTLYSIESATTKKISYYTYYFMFWAVEVNMIIFRLVVSRVHGHFVAINATLNKLLQEHKNKPHQFYHYGQIQKITLAYEVANTAVKQINSSFGVPLLLYLAHTFLQLNISNYLLIMSTYFQRNPYFASMLVAWSLYYPFSLILTISPCHDTHYEIRAIRGHVSKLFLCARSVHDPLAVELDLLYKMLLLRRAAYTPMNVCTLTRGLVLGIFGSLSTYLTILIQLK